MAVARPWKRPELPDRPILKKLNDQLHDLRLDAGLPSARFIRNRIGRDDQGCWIVNHQAVLDIFQNAEIPQLGRLELIVEALAESARLGDVSSEIDRFKRLWKLAFEETVAQAPMQGQINSTAPASAEAANSATSLSEGTEIQDDGDTDGPPLTGSTTNADTSTESDQSATHFDYAWESLKSLIIHSVQALWNDKDALEIFLGVVRRSENFAKLADAMEGMGERPANATYYGVKSKEFERGYSPAPLELSALHDCLDQNRVKRKWSFSEMEDRTGVPSSAWIRWSTRQELPERKALVAFASAARLQLDDRVLLLGLWDAAHDALQAQKIYESLPSSISFDAAWAMHDPVMQKMWALAGIGDDGSAAYGADLSSGLAPVFMVAGPSGSGRSTALVSIARALLASGTKLVLAAPKPSPLRELAERDGVISCFMQDDLKHDELKNILSVASLEEPIAIVIDDAEVLAECDAWHLLNGIVQHGFEEGLALVVGRDEDKIMPYGRWLGNAQKACRGLLLSPQKIGAGDLIGIKIGSSFVGSSVIPGRGWLHLGDGKLLAVTVPW
ncbi:ATP-binding protein [Actinomadura gamaensis]|uniref:ATP-binding protein n=1 Tax=Actinomadura gamaensis TaxID=1763541 RepID=A0ABV9TWR4_9ACTN